MRKVYGPLGLRVCISSQETSSLGDRHLDISIAVFEVTDGCGSEEPNSSIKFDKKKELWGKTMDNRPPHHKFGELVPLKKGKPEVLLTVFNRDTRPHHQDIVEGLLKLFGAQANKFLIAGITANQRNRDRRK